MVLPALALAFAFAAPASANGDGHWWMHFNDELNVQSSNNANVYNVTKAESDTGDNSTFLNYGFGSGNIVTGAAMAGADSGLFVNSNMTTLGAPCDCFDDVTITSANNAVVYNKTKAEAETGENTTTGNGGYFDDWYYGGGSGNIVTGAAVAGATSWTVVNSNVTGF